MDLCHPNNPDCVTGVTCSDCDDGFNPHLIVACNLVTFSDVPLDGGAMVSVDEFADDLSSRIMLYPNPSDGNMTLEMSGNAGFDEATVSILGLTGKVYDSFVWHGETKQLNLTAYSNGVYFVKIKTGEGMAMRKIIIQ